MSDSLPAIPMEVAQLAVRRIPRWGRTISQIAGFAVVVVALGSILNFVAYYLAREMYPLSRLRAAAPVAFMAICDALVVYWFMRALAYRRIASRGRLVMGHVSEAIHRVRRGHVVTLTLTYRFQLDGVPLQHRVWIRDGELRGLPQLPDRRDYVIVAYDPARPTRNLAWGFVFADGGVFYPR